MPFVAWQIGAPGRLKESVRWLRRCQVEAVELCPGRKHADETTQVLKERSK